MQIKLKNNITLCDWACYRQGINHFKYRRRDVNDNATYVMIDVNEKDNVIDIYNISFCGNLYYLNDLYIKYRENIIAPHAQLSIKLLNYIDKFLIHSENLKAFI